MQLEVNLLKVVNVYSINGKIISRKRYSVADDADIMVAITNFISENLDYINSVITNKELISKLSVLKTMATDEFNALNYLFADAGIMITYYIVSDVEVDADGVPSDSIEYNVVDKMNYLTSFVPYSTKIVVDNNDYSTSKLYEKIANMYGLFMDDLFGGVNPIMNDIQVMNTAEQLTGSAPEGVITHINSILNFLGKQVWVITN